MPSWTQELELRLASLRLAPAREAEIIDELSEHLELRYAELRDQGVAEAEALKLVRAELLDEKSLAEFMRPLRQAHAARPPVPVGAPHAQPAAKARRARFSGLFDSLGHDLRHELLGLRRRPGFAAAAVLTLALGIGATTAIFSVVYSVLIKPLPYPNAGELVRIRHSFNGNLGGADFEPTMYFTYKDESRTFADIGLWFDGSATLTDGGEPERLRALRVTDGVLHTLGVQPQRGRWFEAAEYEPAADGAAPVILSYAFWQRRFAGDAAVVGRQVSIDSQPASVVGVMPRDFRFLDLTPQPDVIVAQRLGPRAEQVISLGMNYQGIARVRAGVTPAEAAADVERMLGLWRAAWPLRTNAGLTREVLETVRIVPIVRPLKDDVVGDVASMLWVLMGAIGAVLLVACANIANLLLVRADARRQEFAVRAALGAVPARIARELLVESSSIGAAGSVLGLLLAYVGLRVLVAIGPSNLPRLHEIALYPPVLAFTVAVALAATLAFGCVTAFKAARTVGISPIAGARGSTASREHGATRNGLVVAQVALALVLVVSAALMIRTFQALRDVDPGFVEPATVQTARIWMPNSMMSDPQAYTRLQHEMLDRIAALPGVESAAFASMLPMESPPIEPPILVEGQTLDSALTRRGIKFVSPGYFEAMGTRIIAGRDITWSDIETGGRVALISEDFARELAPEPLGALGKRIRTYAATDAWREVIGVVQSVHEAGLREEAPSFVYWPTLVADMYGSPVLGSQSVAFVVRSERAGSATLTNEIRQAVWGVSGSVPVTAERTVQDVYASSLARTSFVLAMLAVAGGMALLLGVIGIYGVIAYVVAQRTREIGIRAALGAPPGALERMFLLHGLRLTVVGAVVGIVAAAASGRAMSSLLFGVDALDAAAYAAALGITLAAAALASYLPARRAAAVDPIETLKAD